ncbi:hypothetical protein GGX14DRAFT_399556 [Mycena pura]|uniref:Uncharacterized protein n=1 Tax=Mycena pura TaxID=153505 RepID=A0AAD6Y6T4_9AGAR|nr:hypothetical protein GGX14DRAFT_399556 [Mycena pura]
MPPSGKSKSKPKPRHGLPLPTPAPPRNSFTETDYYRTTKEEIHSPISRAEEPYRPQSPFGDARKASSAAGASLTRIHEGSEPESSDEGCCAAPQQQRVQKPTVSFWVRLPFTLQTRRRLIPKMAPLKGHLSAYQQHKVCFAAIMLRGARM